LLLVKAAARRQLIADRANGAASQRQQLRHNNIEPVYRPHEKDRRRHNKIADEQKWRNQATTSRLRDF